MIVLACKLLAIAYVIAIVTTIPYLTVSESQAAVTLRRILHIP
jgi:hypothetical protein